MRNFISENDIEQAILDKLRAKPFEYDVIVCDADPSKREALPDGTGRASKRECVLPDILLSSLKQINPTIEDQYLEQIVKDLRRDFTGTDMIATNYKLYQQLRNGIKITVRRNGKEGGKSCLKPFSRNRHARLLGSGKRSKEADNEGWKHRLRNKIPEGPEAVGRGGLYIQVDANGRSSATTSVKRKPNHD